jgi:Flp pilus assembly protein TadG
MVDFGLALYSNINVMNATREGARLGIISPDATAIEARVRSMATGLDQSQLTVSTTCREQSGSSWVACTAPLWQPGDTMVVTSNYTYQMIWPLAFGNDIGLTSTVQMRIE